MKHENKHKFLFVVLTIFALSVPGIALVDKREQSKSAPDPPSRSGSAPQQQPTPPVEKPSTEDDVIKVTTNVVQVDAVVTDKSGKVVSDLTPADFEVLEDGKRVKTEYFSFVPLTVKRNSEPVGESQPKTPNTEQISNGDLKRTFVFLVDNPLIDVAISDANAYGISSTSVSFKPRALRAAAEAEKLLRWFVDGQMSANDLVAITDTQVNIGVLRSFTNDREVLGAAITRIRANALSSEKQVIRLTAVNGETGLHALVLQNLSALETVSKVIDQMTSLPGRKIVSLISSGMVYDSRMPGSEVIKAKMQELVAKANRARVTIYTMSPRGLGNVGGVSMVGSRGAAPGRLNAVGLTQGLQDIDSMVYLAKETGGRAIYSTNDARVGFSEVLEENAGYYLLGYNPGPEAVERPHKLKVVVKRDGLKVQARTTAYATNRSELIASPVAALNSPLALRDIKLDLNSLHISPDGRRSRLVSVVRIDLNTLPPEAKVPLLEMLVRVTGPDGKIVKEETSRITLKTTNEPLRDVITMVSAVEDAVPGYYRVAVAVSEPETGLTGSVTKFVDVVNPASSDLSASSLILSRPGSTADELAIASLVERRFGSKSKLSYQCMVYNAQSKDAKDPQVQLQLMIKRGDEVVVSAPGRTVSGTAGAPISVGGMFSLPNLPQGSYRLELAIEDTNRKNSQVVRTASFDVR